MSGHAPMRSFAAAAFPPVRLWVPIAGLALAELAFDVMWLPVAGLLGDARVAGTDAAALTLVLVAYALPVVALGLWMRRMQGRGVATLFGPAARVRADLVAAVKGTVIVYVGMTLALALVPAGMAEGPDGTIRPFASWLAVLPFAASAILVQSAAEELIFRGYMMQELFSRFRSRWIWLGVPALLFGSVHFVNGSGAADGLFYAIWAAALGLACGDLVARTGSIGAAIGLHWVNNIFAMLFFGTEDAVDSGYALFLAPAEPSVAPGPGIATFFTGQTLLDLALALVWVGNLWLGARIALRR
ncbi:lysostaphin resistance A-like protein [Palleronia sp.]|uniref:CPBP family intramembrane glutamic endopeptidase n=1 Tax=Palleronia sp. TaxID=1940284 RepID=UPI0035C86904